ncbi:MAG TPA: substrate-binding domain-containing protein [Stellaceae bacterium]|jgi:ABC-type molybdate transport system substrate-binding protein/uncharacterized membrane protein|nr:substrate-binding domain-containing protein [Stellaceae bacterium]
MVLVAYGGLLFAPAAHAASLYTGLIPLNVAILAAVVLSEAFTVAKRIGFALILPGVLGIVWGAGGTIGSRQNIGHALFIGAGILWACYTVAMRKARLEGLHAAAIAAVGSLVSYVPVYAINSGTSLANAPWRDVALQAFVQGLLTAVISLLLYGRAVSILGASNGAAFAALCPAMTALLAIPILGEWPATIDWIAILLISCGVYFVSGGPLPARRMSAVRLVRLLMGISVCVVIMAAGLVNADDPKLTVFAAGSLREALGAIAEDFGAAHKIQIRTEFGPSGRMRERIEHGEHADLFASADIGHARTVVEEGRATVMAMFARNSICALIPQTLGLTEATIVDKLLDPATRIGISTPKVDPLGDYTIDVYRRINQEHAGAADDLMARSTVIGVPPGGPEPRSGDTFADALQDGSVDLEILYCSGRDRFARLLPTATMTPFPPALQVGPEYALAVLKNCDPLAAELALYMLSPKGQATLASSGFIPASLPQADR